MNGLTYELSQRQLQDYCPAIQIDEQNNIDEASLQSCTALVSELNRAPLTPGRDLLAAREWNAWADLQYQHSENRRGFSPIDGKGSTLSLGADRLVNPDFALGIMLTASDQDANTLAGKMTTESDSMMAGPYFSFGFNPKWSLFGNVMAGRTNKDYRLLTLNGDNSVNKYSATLNLEGNYAIAAASFIRPKLGLSYNYEAGSTYQLSGALLGKQLQIVVDGHSHEAGQMQASTEFNTRLESPQGYVIVPYFETGLLYNVLQPSSSLDPDWQGMLRAGLRTVAGKSLQIDVNASYQSIGVSNLNVWNCTLFVAYAF